jgi:hypothetical protein
LIFFSRKKIKSDRRVHKGIFVQSFRGSVPLTLPVMSTFFSICYPFSGRGVVSKGPIFFFRLNPMEEKKKEWSKGGMGSLGNFVCSFVN